MSEIPVPEEGPTEVEPEVILRDIARVLESAIPAIRLTPSLGEPVDISSLFDGEPDEVEAALVSAGKKVRALGMVIHLNSECGGGCEVTTTNLSSERWVHFAEQVLSDIQDAISEATALPWPEVRVDGRRTQADYGACLNGRFLQMWYGEKDEPVLKFEPVVVLRPAIADGG